MINTLEESKSKRCVQQGSNCSADKCLAWRWSDRDELSGYCGLAGVPREAALVLESDIADHMTRVKVVRMKGGREEE